MNRLEHNEEDENISRPDDIVTEPIGDYEGVFSDKEIDPTINPKLDATDLIVSDIGLFGNGDKPIQDLSHKDIVALSLLRKLSGTATDPDSYMYRTALLRTQKYSNEEIATILGISEKNVEKEWEHVSELIKKDIPLTEEQILDPDFEG